MRKSSLLFLIAFICIGFPFSMVSAQQDDYVDKIVIQKKANDLKDLLDHLLLDSNHSSIQTIIKEGDEPVKALIAEAFRRKSQGEQLLAENKYMEAAISLQSALDYVFQAIREGGKKVEPPDVLKAKLKENKKVNDTFLGTASRVINGENNKNAFELLEMAKEARNRADVEFEAGKKEAALLELEHSTRLAQQAIISVREGKVIERGQ